MKGYIKLVTATAILAATAGCSRSEQMTEKRSIPAGAWFDYGNGLINLAQVKNITSESSISFSVSSKDYVDNQKRFQDYRDALDDEKRAIVDAHLDFCYDRIHSDSADENNRQGRLEWTTFSRSSSIGDYVSGSGKSDLKNSIEGFKNLLSAEFVKTCAVTIRENASLIFDGFKVTLPSTEKVFNMTFDEKSPPSDSAVRSEFDTAIGGLKEGLTPWDATYSNLVKG